jgi:hypothetical protein
MKGLMLKELYLSAKYRIIVLSTYGLLFILCVLVRLSSVYGNIANMTGRDMVVNSIFKVMALGLPLILYSSVFNIQVLNDEKCHFRQYSHTLPLTEKQIVGSVYLLCLIFFGIATLAGWVNYFIACGVYGREIDLKYLLYIVIIGSVSFVVSCINMSNAYRYRSNKICTAIIAVTCIILYLGIAAGFMGLMYYYYKQHGYDLFAESGSEKEPPDATMNDFMNDLAANLRWVGAHFWWLFLLTGAALVYLSFCRSVKALERRSN